MEGVMNKAYEILKGHSVDELGRALKRMELYPGGLIGMNKQEASLFKYQLRETISRKLAGRW